MLFCLLPEVCLPFFLLLFSLSPLFAKGNSPFSNQFPPHSLQGFYSAKQSKDKPAFSVIKGSFAVVSATALNVRSGPSTKNPVLKVILKDTHILPLSSPKHEWLKIRDPKRHKRMGSQKACKDLYAKTFVCFQNKTSLYALHISAGSKY